MTQTGNKNWVEVLPMLVDNYNNTVSRITGKTPNDLDNPKLENKNNIKRRME